MGLKEVTVEDSFWVPDAPRGARGALQDVVQQKSAGG